MIAALPLQPSPPSAGAAPAGEPFVSSPEAEGGVFEASLDAAVESVDASANCFSDGPAIDAGDPVGVAPAWLEPVALVPQVMPRTPAERPGEHGTAFTIDGSLEDAEAAALRIPSGARENAVPAPERQAVAGLRHPGNQVAPGGPRASEVPGADTALDVMPPDRHTRTAPQPAEPASDGRIEEQEPAVPVRRDQEPAMPVRRDQEGAPRTGARTGQSHMPGDDATAAPAATTSTRAELVMERHDPLGRLQFDTAAPPPVSRPVVEQPAPSAVPAPRIAIGDVRGEASPVVLPVAAAASSPDDGAPDASGGDVRSGAGHEPQASLPGPAAARPAVAPTVVLTPGAEGVPGAVASSAASLATPDSLMTTQERAENVGRLVQSMRVLVRDGASEATVRLRPEHLGDVTISLRVDGRSVAAVVRAEAARVREWLQSQHESLRQSLALHGLSLDRLEVEPDEGRERRGHEEEPPPRPRPRPASVDGGPRFDVIV